MSPIFPSSLVTWICKIIASGAPKKSWFFHEPLNSIKVTGMLLEESSTPYYPLQLLEESSDRKPNDECQRQALQSAMTNDFFFLSWMNYRTSGHVWFQQDGATAHTAHEHFWRMQFQVGLLIHPCNVQTEYPPGMRQKWVYFVINAARSSFDRYYIFSSLRSIT